MNPPSASDSEDEACLTPTGTTANTTTSLFSSTAGRQISFPPSYASLTRAPIAVCPQKDTTFLIRDPRTNLVITLRDGILKLQPDEKAPSNELTGTPYHGRGSHWHCIENGDLWLGFRSAVSGCYIGHNNNKRSWRFIAEVKHHKGWEYFCARAHPDGGHVLLVKHNNGFRGMKAGGVLGRDLCVCEPGESGTAWDFIKVSDLKE
ncbi:hypothetical protein BJY04DRAFT_194014 [Aspergillus karnatakaensis]|uniref:uncharacterized protein n=1 Tax=Aspergillus karnatakaensis TaxID=1810916 RepID=UPI003CCD920F